MEGETQLSALLNRGPRSSLAYGVPKILRKANKEAYTPQAVSIGPLHYGETHLQPMLPNKEQYLKHFFARTAADKSRYDKMVKEYWGSGEARAYYQGHVHLDQNDFIKMLLVDGIFIIEFFLRMCLHEKVEENDEIFQTGLLREDIRHDVVILLENQLPFALLKELYISAKIDLQWEELLFFIANTWFKKGVSLDKTKETLNRYEIRHLVSFLHTLCVVTIPKDKSECNTRPKFELSRSAKELHEAGVEFSVCNNKLPFDVKFTNGTLEFPPIIVDRWTELSFRNFIAHEHCLHRDKIITSYIILMGNLLQTAKDVDLLVELKIIDNRSLGNSEDVCTLMKKLYDRSMMDKSEFYYTSLCEKLNNYSKDPWHQWKAAGYRWKEMLKRDYFGNPWTIISVVYAFVLLILTVIQTMCSYVTVR